MRTIAAFLIAPLVVAVPLASYVFFRPTPLPEPLLEFLVVTVMVYSVAATFTVLLAVPLFLLFRRFNLVNLWTAVLSGTVVGGVGALLYSDFVWSFAAWNCALGGLAGLVFWSIWRPRQAGPRLVKRLVLSQTSNHWQNSFRVVSHALKDAESRRFIVDSEAIADQLWKLVADGHLESRGELRDLRSSEIRDRS